MDLTRRRRIPAIPGLETWSSLEAARHGGGYMWIPGPADPATRLYITGTANPTPAYTSQNRGSGDNLYTCSLRGVARRHRQAGLALSTSPHDTHDWDSSQTPVLVDAPFGGQRPQARSAGHPERLLLRPRPHHR